MELNDRIRYAAAELWALQEALINAASQSVSGQAGMGQIIASVDDAALQELKAAADHARHLLWAYIDEARKMRGVDPDEVLFQYRIRRISEMLRIVSPQLAKPNRSLSKGTAELVEGIYSILSRIMVDQRRDSRTEE